MSYDLPQLPDLPESVRQVAYCPPPDAGLDVVFVDDDCVVVNKPSGLLSVPGRGEDKHDSLIVRVQQRYPDALTVHRLDMDTSGLVVFGRGAAMQRELSILFQQRRVHKRYIAITEGVMADDRGHIDLPLIVDWPNRPRHKVDHVLGKPSLTRYQVQTRDPVANTTRVALEPVTGRSHQLRVHLLSLGHPIVGDELYALQPERYPSSRLLLHAEWLALPHPRSGEPMSWLAPAPF